RGDLPVAERTSRHDSRELGSFKELTIRVEKRLAFKDGVAERFAEQVQGANAGDRKIVDITMSTTVADESLRGKTVKATLEIKDVKTLRMPELTHDFLHHFGVHSEEQFKEL